MGEGPFVRNWRDKHAEKTEKKNILKEVKQLGPHPIEFLPPKGSTLKSLFCLGKMVICTFTEPPVSVFARGEPMKKYVLLNLGLGGGGDVDTRQRIFSSYYSPIANVNLMCTIVRVLASEFCRISKNSRI